MADYQKVEFKSEPSSADNPEQTPALETTEAPPQQEFPVETPQEPVVERPEWLPEKFDSPESLAFAYKQLEQEFSKKGNDEQPADQTGGLDPETFMALSEEFDETGDVSEASRERLAATGIPRQFIDEYIEGQKIVAENAVQDMYNTVGGQEAYDNMLQWASQNLSDTEIDVFNDLVAGTQEEASMAVSGLYARFMQSGDTPPTKQPLVQGDTNPELPSGSAFQSRAQVVEAMSDPRYKKDPAYRQEVYRRLQNTQEM